MTSGIVSYLSKQSHLLSSAGKEIDIHGDQHMSCREQATRQKQDPPLADQQMPQHDSLDCQVKDAHGCECNGRD